MILLPFDFRARGASRTTVIDNNNNSSSKGPMMGRRARLRLLLDEVFPALLLFPVRTIARRNACVLMIQAFGMCVCMYIGLYALCAWASMPSSIKFINEHTYIYIHMQIGLAELHAASFFCWGGK